MVRYACRGNIYSSDTSERVLVGIVFATVAAICDSGVSKKNTVEERVKREWEWKTLITAVLFRPRVMRVH